MILDLMHLEQRKFAVSGNHNVGPALHTFDRNSDQTLSQLLSGHIHSADDMCNLGAGILMNLMML